MPQANQSQIVNISLEKYRTYVYSETKRVTVTLPVSLESLPNGGQIVVDRRRVHHYFPPGFIQISWEEIPVPKTEKAESEKGEGDDESSGG